ncbi:hypothetical protein JL09_g7100, partial [Pichia kudriavzevii]
CSCSL